MSDETNFASLQAQIDEIEVLQSIYGDTWKVVSEASGSYAIDITENGVTVALFVSLPVTYPKESPPVYTISAPCLSKKHKDHIARVLNNEYLDNIGESVLYQWIEKIREFLLELNDEQAVEANEMLEEWVDDVQEHQAVCIVPVPDIIHGEVITDRKSSFQGHLARVKSVQEVRHVIEALKENRRIANATHNMYAYRIALGNGSFAQDCEDDGETQAGSRLLHFLQIINISEVLVLVSRWYGGVHLGPDRFRHINNAARQVLIQAQLLSPTGKR